MKNITQPKNNLIILIIICIWVVSNNAQNKSGSSVIMNLLESKIRVPKIHSNYSSRMISEQSSFQKKQAIKNINKFLISAANLRRQGKSEQEINLIVGRKVLTGTGLISGTVYESDGISPISNSISIKLFDKYGQYITSSYIRTYSAGKYTIKNLSEGKYYVLADAYAGYYKSEYYDNASDWMQATLVQANDGLETAGINFSLDHYNGVITGKVLDVMGNPLPNCFVDAFGDLSGFYYSTTDSTGCYSINNLMPDKYIIRCTSDIGNYASQYYYHAVNEAEALAVSLSTEDTVKNINFNLDYGGAISGKITKEDGSLFKNYYIRVNLETDSTNYYISETYPDSNGVYVLDKLNAGKYKLFAVYNGNENYAKQWFNNSSSRVSAEAIQVIAGDTVSNIDISLKPGSIISGKILRQIMLSIYIYVFDVDSNLIGSTYLYYSEKDSTPYTINKLLPGNYKILASSKDYGDIWYNNKDNFNNADVVRLNEKDSVANINFDYQSSPSHLLCGIKGMIYNPEGLACAAAIGIYNLEGRLIRSTYGDPYNGYIFINLPLGSYKLIASNNEYADEWFNNKNGFLSADTIILSSNYPKVINIHFRDYVCSLAGFTVDENGVRLSNDSLNISAIALDPITGKEIALSNLSFNGGYKMKLHPGEYKLALLSTYENSKSSIDSVAVTYFDNGTTFNDAATDLIHINPKTDLELNDFKMQKAKGTILGTIYYGDSTLSSNSIGYILVAYDEFGYMSKLSIYSKYNNPINGSYKICGLRPGKYYLLGILLGNNELESKWYNGIDKIYSSTDITFRMDLPENITPITVTENETNGINFYFNQVTNYKDHKIVLEYKLEQNYPNPFNPSTVISYQLKTAGKTTLIIYNLLGQEVKTLVNEVQSAGEHKVKWNASGFASGVYMYRLESSGFVQARKMILTK